MRLKPNDSPEMEVGESRNFQFNLPAAVGANTITDFAIEASGLSFGTPNVNGTSVTVLCNADQIGTHMAKVTAELSSSETVIGVARVKVLDSTCETSGRDYR
jgi:hypothetical protein